MRLLFNGPPNDLEVVPGNALKFLLEQESASINIVRNARLVNSLPIAIHQDNQRFFRIDNTVYTWDQEKKEIMALGSCDYSFVSTLFSTIPIHRGFSTFDNATVLLELFQEAGYKIIK